MKGKIDFKSLRIDSTPRTPGQPALVSEQLPPAQPDTCQGRRWKLWFPPSGNWYKWQLTKVSAVSGLFWIIKLLVAKISLCLLASPHLCQLVRRQIRTRLPPADTATPHGRMISYRTNPCIFLICTMLDVLSKFPSCFLSPPSLNPVTSFWISYFVHTLQSVQASGSSPQVNASLRFW